MLLCPWFGPLPEWYWQYATRRVLLADYGYTLVIPTDEAVFRRRCIDNLGIEPPPMAGNGKIHDFRPVLAAIYPDLVAGYDFWGHTDLDCVYGRVGEFFPDDHLAGVDVVSDHPSYLCGPWTLYRNTPELAFLYAEDEDWRLRLTDPHASGWVETDWTDLVANTVKVDYRMRHAYRDPVAMRWDGDRLMEHDEERSFYHFRYTKKWPETLA